MCSSAIASSSAVVTPGRTCSPISASVSATTRPARAICSISLRLFRMIIDPWGKPGFPRVPPHWGSAGRSPAPPKERRLRVPDDRLAPSPSSPDRHLLERVLDLGEDLVHGAVGVDADDVAADRAVALHER